MEVKECTFDIEYKQDLAKAIGCPAKDLCAVMGEQELRYTLQNIVNEKNFTLGLGHENVKQGIFSINLHIHTKYSDGNFEIAELLDHAVEYANKRRILGHKDPFILAITDHDTLEGSQNAVKLIAQNPEKYSNIRFVPGIELNSYFITENNRKKQLEIHAYCINPFVFSKYVDNIRQTNLKYIHEILENYSKITLEDLRKVAKYVRAGGSPALMSEVLPHIIDNKQVINSHLEKFGDLSINPGSPELKELPAALKNYGGGFLSVAHPGRPLKNFDIGQLFYEFKAVGVEGIEAHYHYIHPDNVRPEFKNYIIETAKQTGLLCTGGIDSHSKSLFIGREEI